MYRCPAAPACLIIRLSPTISDLTGGRINLTLLSSHALMSADVVASDGNHFDMSKSAVSSTVNCSTVQARLLSKRHLPHNF